ncbi:hypothetical protein ACFPOI_30830 [Nonomuraea angiospora]|uniref:Lectin-like protein BA14k n=1 Tax=Nonomuraea angiospora TaxID=46172 RepID=A0ABR9LW38_9ACTN|nr:hypothetical protein [Nonomuraea angiospora]MBE1584473.1 hypothetical protein [Nonomuraea angiospora]MDX3102265.1 hypothetical protein [Nonomuraea angiospora]
MRIKKSLILAGPALLTAVTLSPLAASPAQALAETSAASAQTTTLVASKPPKEKKAEYKKGRMAGYSDGRSACEKKEPYSLKYSGGGAYQRGFTDGYNSGYHSC